MSKKGSSTDGAALARVESHQYPTSHLGHLTTAQGESLAAFKKLCAQKQYFTPETPEAPASHDDETMLRYLRARKFNPPEAFKQFKDTEDWRRQEKIDELYDTIDVQEYDESRRLYPQWTGRRDKRGIPVYVFEVAHLNSKRMSAYDKAIASATSPGKTPPKLIRLFALYENLLRFVMPLCSGIPNRPYKETPVSQSSNIVDISGVGLKQFWNLRQHMQDASQLATAHYPETLDRIFIIGAPSFFPTVWAWIKNWFDPITVSKIFILSKEDMKRTLDTYIDPANVPVKYGGLLQWEWGTLPALEPAIDKALKWEDPDKTPAGANGFPAGPVKWVKDDATGDLVAIAVGSEGGKRRNRTIARLPVQSGLALGAVTPQGAAVAGAADGVAALSVADTAADPMFGHPSTSGAHTHPQPGQDYFPTTGDTPPSEPEPTESSTDIPATTQSAESQAQPGYIEQAKGAATSAAATAGGLGSAVLATVGLGGSATPEANGAGKADGAEAQEAEKAKEDPRVDAMGDEHVEEYLRSKTTTKQKQPSE